MPAIKIYPPDPLPQEKVSDAQFNIWKNKLEVYLNREKSYRKFLPGGQYSTWIAAEQNELRITTALNETDDIQDIQCELREVITLISEVVHIDYYNPIHRQSTSLEWIYKKLRKDYNIQQQGIHYLQILDFKYDPTENVTPIGFYNSYRSFIIGHMKKKGTKLSYNNTTLQEDEPLTASHEEHILVVVLSMIHPKLPYYVKEHYAHKIGVDLSILDFKEEILTNAKEYIHRIENTSTETADIAAIKNDSQQPLECNYINSNRSFGRGRGRGQFRPQQFKPHQFRPQFKPNWSSSPRPTWSSSSRPAWSSSPRIPAPSQRWF